MRVEFFGVPRERAGVSETEVEAATLGQLFDELEARFADFSGPAFAANLNGDRFVSDRATPLRREDCVLILSADAGG